MPDHDKGLDAIRVQGVVSQYHADVQANIAPLFLKLERRVEQLEAQNADLRSRVDELEHQLRQRKHL